jgi:sensor c-di-GMP phosphodiesterase-like protein
MGEKIHRSEIIHSMESPVRNSTKDSNKIKLDLTKQNLIDTADSTEKIEEEKNSVEAFEVAIDDGNDNHSNFIANIDNTNKINNYEDEFEFLDESVDS